MAIIVLLLALMIWTSYLAYKSFRKPGKHLGFPVSLLFTGVAIFGLAFILELLSSSLEAMLLWNNLAYVGLALLMLGLGLLLLNYLGWVDQWDKRSLVIFSVMPVLTIVMVATNEWTSFYYSKVGVGDFMGHSFLDTERALGYLITVGYVLLLCAVILILIIRSLFGAIQTNLTHMAVLGGSILIAMVLTALPNPFAQFPSAFLLFVSLSLLSYPVYVVTFKEGIFAWSLSYKAVLDLSTDIKMIIDRGRILYYNQQAANVLGDPPEIPDIINDHIADQGTRTPNHEIMLRIGDEQLYYDFEAIPLTSRIGIYQATMVSMKDVTDEVRTRDALSLANEKLKLLSSISRHDMINQLTVVSGMAYLLEDILDNERSSRVLTSMNKAADAIHRQLMFMKDFDQVGSSNPEWLRLEDVVSEAVGQHELDEIQFDYQAGSYQIFADPLFPKVFENLIHNTLFHGKDVSNIVVGTEETEQGLHIHYRDDGEGIPTDFRDVLFEKGEGTDSGLGLYLVKNILEVAGMTIEEESLGRKGVDFVITVPPGAYRVDSS